MQDCISADGKTSNECTRYDIKQSDGEAPIMLELWEMWITPSLTLISDPLKLGVIATHRVLSMGQIEMFDI